MEAIHHLPPADPAADANLVGIRELLQVAEVTFVPLHFPAGRVTALLLTSG